MATLVYAAKEFWALNIQESNSSLINQGLLFVYTKNSNQRILKEIKKTIKG